MNEKQRMMKRVQMYDFILDELNLYLDTHPNDRNALDYFTQYQYLKNDAVNQYEARFGPLRAEDSMGEDYFDWIKGPWPWESEVK